MPLLTSVVLMGDFSERAGTVAIDWANAQYVVNRDGAVDLVVNVTKQQSKHTDPLFEEIVAVKDELTHSIRTRGMFEAQRIITLLDALIKERQNG